MSIEAATDPASMILRFRPLAEQLARKWFRMQKGSSRGIALADVLAAAQTKLQELAITYKPALGSIVAAVKPAIWRYLERRYPTDSGLIARPCSAKSLMASAS